MHMTKESEMASPLRLRLLAEALGTFLFFFLGFNAIAVSTDLGGGAISTLGIAFAFGLGLALAITALGHISGGHFNPAVSLGLATALKFPAQEVIPYWIAQLVGGIVAVLAVSVVYSGQAVERSSPRPASVSRTEAHSCSS
jgi:aquaporin Z